MLYVHLGRSGVRVSRLCLGTMNFGPHASEADSFRMMDRASNRELIFSIPPMCMAGKSVKA